MADLTGQTLGKYQLLERLGRGGMADVYKGFQPGLDRYVAVKVLHPHLSEEPDFITRFQREAKNVATLRHPHIVQVFDFDVQGEHYYMVMEYVEGGRTLKELLQELAARDQRLPFEHTLSSMAKLADALDYAHGQGMIHRDIKPSNILFPRLNHPVLSDFGIARMMGQTGLTSSGAMIGTPAYMSPEQGRGERADERSDIYALGIVLYEMLTGRPPYDADTPYGVILKHINDPIIPPRTVIGALPEAIEQIVFKSLAKNPDDRYTTSGAMRDALRAALEQLAEATPISAPTPPMGVAGGEQAKAATAAGATVPASAIDGGETLAVPPAAPAGARAARKPRWWVWAAAAVAGAVLLGGAAVVGLGLLAAGSEDVGLAGELPLPAGEGQAGGPAGEQAEPPSDDAGALAQEGVVLFSEGSWDEALEVFSQVLQMDPNNTDALTGRALIQMDWENADASAADLQRAYEIAPDDAFVNFGLGQLYHTTGDYYDPEAALEKLTLAAEGCGERAWLCADAYRERAAVLAWDMGDVENALADIELAMGFESDPLEVPYHYAERASMLFWAAGDPLGAMEDYETAYELSGGDGWFLESAAEIAVRIGDYDRALDYYQRLMADSAGDPYYLIGQGYVYWQAGDSQGALSDAERALELDPGLLGAHYLLGLVLLDEGEPEAALKHFTLVSREPDMWSYAAPFFTPDFGHNVFYEMARAALALGDSDQALEWSARALEEDDYWPQPYILRGQILQERGDLAGARENYQMALETVYDEPELQAEIEELLRSLAK